LSVLLYRKQNHRRVPFGALSSAERGRRKTTPAVAHPCTTIIMIVVILICYNYHCHRGLVRTLLYCITVADCCSNNTRRLWEMVICRLYYIYALYIRTLYLLYNNMQRCCYYYYYYTCLTRIK